MDRRATCVLCRRQPVDPRWRPFCSRRCQQEDLARWAEGTHRIAGPPVSFDDADDDGTPAQKP
jgi:endogenous inhibitor of DNA gyrase (YacG/DUF329 family)